MKKSMLKASLLFALSSFLIACGSGGHPTQSPSQESPKPNEQKIPQKENNQANGNKNQNSPKPNDKTDSPKQSIVEPTPPTHNNMNSNIQGVKPNEETLNATWKLTACSNENNCQSIEKRLKDMPLTTMELKLGENKEEGDYQFTLLGENQNGVAFYGYFNDSQITNKNTHGLVYGRRNDLENKSIPTDFTATYAKNNGFVYVLSSQKNNKNDTHHARYADISISYSNGHATGVVKESNNHTVLFDITSTNKYENKNEKNTLLITPTDKAKDIPNDDKATFYVHILDSSKTTNDHKYIVGSGSASTWYGAFIAEKTSDKASQTKAEK
ncbi:hypothetical protein [Pasteurella sp. PK-2025]|uniref:hypothetical protein n=1 Tax=Pasteurella sp. PK-2025 TaxID=3413133 RepID=UPI003C7879B6